MSVDALLDRLDAVRQVGAGRWRARCPSHDSKSRDVLSIAESTDGATLVHCFHGCSAADVVRAVGLELHDLFPRDDWRTSGKHSVRPRRPHADWPALVAACERDLLLVKIVLGYLARREPVNEVDAQACQAAATRVFTLLTEARNA